MTYADICRCCGHPRAEHELLSVAVDGADGILECPNRAGYVTPEQFEPVSTIQAE